MIDYNPKTRYETAEENFVAGFKTGIALSAGLYLLRKAYKRGIVQVNWKQIKNNHN